MPENVYQLYESLRDYEIETWINNAGFGSYDSVTDQDLGKIRMMLNLNIEALTILSSLYVRDYKGVEGLFGWLTHYSLMQEIHHIISSVCENRYL